MSATQNTPLGKTLYKDSVLYASRLTKSKTEVEYWEYNNPVLSSKYDTRSARGASRSLARRDWNMRQTQNNVRRLVNSNVGQYGYEAVFLTFTYKENVTDIDLAWSDWHAFMKKMRRRFGTLHALSVMEFQKRGAIHFHCIFFNLPPVVEAQERKTRTIADLWGHGFVDIERIRSAKNVGAYVCKYLNKSADDERLRGKKFYSTTLNLFRPVELRGDLAKEKMMSIVTSEAVELLAETVYQYGGADVTYRNYKLFNP